MSKPETVWIKYSVSDSDDWMAAPSVGLHMAVSVEFVDGKWVVTARDAGADFVVRSENRELALLKLLAVRLGLSLEEGQ